MSYAVVAGNATGTLPTGNAAPAPVSALDSADILEAGRAVFLNEAQALAQLAERLDGDFCDVVRMILGSSARLIVMGVGKSGIVGKKIAATLASTGTPAFFVHATEAFHGDLGMIQPGDIALLISQSGATSETLAVVEPLRRIGARIIAMTGNRDSRLALRADSVLLTPVAKEACPNNLAPTTSTTCAMAMGDALAVALMKQRRFGAEHFAGYHPGGSLGRRMARVAGCMRTENLPICTPGTPLLSALSRMTQSRLGLIVVTRRQQIVGIVTDGDIRRALESRPHAGLEAESIPIEALMTPNPVMIDPDATLADAEDLLRARQIKALLVSRDGVTLEGILDLYDI